MASSWVSEGQGIKSHLLELILIMVCLKHAKNNMMTIDHRIKMCLKLTKVSKS